MKSMRHAPQRAIHPSLNVGAKSVVLDSASLAPVATHLLKMPVLHVAGRRADVLDALDTLFGAC
jgi:CcdB protein